MLFCACALPARAGSIQARYAVAECPRAKAAAPASMGSCAVVWAWLTGASKAVTVAHRLIQRVTAQSTCLNIIVYLSIILAICHFDRLHQLSQKTIAILTVGAQHLDGG